MAKDMTRPESNSDSLLLPSVPAGEWHTYRGDEQLSGHCTLAGNIRSPKVQWKYFLGGMMQGVSLIPSTKGFDLLYCSGGSVIRSTPQGEQVWKSKAFGVHGIAAVDDLDGDGTVEIVLSSGRELFILSSETGELLWRTTVGYPVSMGAFAFTILCHQLDKARPQKQLIVSLFSSKDILVFDFSEGIKRGRVLHKLWMDDAFHPTTAIADIDGDGRDEVICSKLGGIYVFDALSANMKSQFRWESGGERRRNYGFFKLIDLDRDGVLEIVILANRVSRHLAVIDNDGKGNLSLLWDRFIEHIYPSDTTEVRYVANSVSDVDGDGLPEIVVGLYNTHGDNRWWLEVIEPISGKVKAEIPESYLYGVDDIDGDGVSELLVSLEANRMPSVTGTLEVFCWRRSAFTLLWGEGNARFAGRGAQIAGSYSNFRPECLAHDETWFENFGGVPGFFILQDDQNNTVVRHVSLTPARRENTLLVPECPGLRIAQVADVDGCGSNELVVSGQRGEILIVKPSGTIVSRVVAGVRLPMDSAFASAKPAPSAVVFRDRGVSVLVVPDNLSKVHVLRLDSKKLEPKLLFERVGKGRFGYDSSFHSPYVVDIDGDDLLELVIANTQGPSSELVAVSGEGGVKGSWSFPAYIASRSDSRLGLYDWTVVRAHDGKLLLLVSFYSSTSMNSEESICVEAATNRVCWERKQIGEGEDGRGFGPWGISSVRRRRRNEPEILFLAKDTVCHFDARTGEMLKKPWQLRIATFQAMEVQKEQNVSTWGSEDDPFTAYGSFIITDVDGDGKDEFVVGGCIGGMGILRSDHSILWWKRRVYNDLLLRLPGVADIDNDGIKEIGVGHADGDFVCYNGLDGSVKWSLNVGAVTTDIQSCDIDGDGKVEFVTGTSDGQLLAIGDGRLKWEYNFGYSVGNPIIADFNNDGLPEIIVAVGDGYLYSVVNAS
jgi:outer membrane protein assembly factor BamB